MADTSGRSVTGLLCLKCRGFGHKVLHCPELEFLTNGDGLEWFCSLERHQVRLRLASARTAPTLCKGCTSLDVVTWLSTEPAFRNIEQFLDLCEQRQAPGDADLDQLAKTFRTLGKVENVEFCSDCSMCLCLFDLTPNPHSGSQEVTLVLSWTLFRMEHHMDINTLEKTKTSKHLTAILDPPAPEEEVHRTVTVGSDGLIIAQGPPGKSQTSLGSVPLNLAAVNIDKVRTWLQLCSDEHQFYCTRTLSDKLNNIRLIDASTRTIVPYSSGSCDYLTLSYVWGQVIQNFPGAGRVGTILPTLPRTLEDAMTLTLQLGKRYIWIDAVCIDQTDPVDREAQVSIMSEIYGGSYATIIALAGQDADAGLPRVSRSRSDLCAQLSCIIDGVKLLTMGPTLEHLLSTTKWYSRAWTYQEARLTPRCITHVKDGLSAFSGMLQALRENAYQNGFLWGLPLAHLNWAMAWQAHSSDDSQNPHFPTWSWLSNEGGMWPGAPSFGGDGPKPDACSFDLDFWVCNPSSPSRRSRVFGQRYEDMAQEYLDVFTGDPLSRPLSFEIRGTHDIPPDLEESKYDRLLFFEGFAFHFAVHERWEMAGNEDHSMCTIEVAGEDIFGTTTYDPSSSWSRAGKQLWLLLTRHVEEEDVVHNVMLLKRAGGCFFRADMLHFLVPIGSGCDHHPSNTSNATALSNLPVRVWLYGGGETNGGIADPMYDGCASASNAILVNVNYRLGALGYLALPKAGFEGNQGIQDQLLALRWVQDNIGRFGGDADKVMLHGQSAGAANAYLLASLPQAPELFSSVILQSGGGRDYETCTTAYEVWDAYAKALKCGVDDAGCISSKPVKELVAAFEKLPVLNSGFGHFPGLNVDSVLASSAGPFVDGKIVPAQPSEVGVQVPSVFGFAAQDGALFAISAFPDPLSISPQNYTAFLTQTYGAPAARTISKIIPFAAFNATGATGFAAIEYVYTLSQYACPTRRGLNKAVANGLPTWAYEFNHTLSYPWIPGVPKSALALLGPTHTSEIPFVFGHTAGLPAPNGTCAFGVKEVALSQFISGAWTNMAEMGRPERECEVWPEYKGAQESRGVTFNNAPVAGVIDFSVCELFDLVREAQLAAVSNQTCLSDPAPAPGSASPAAPVASAANARLRTADFIARGLAMA